MKRFCKITILIMIFTLWGGFLRFDGANLAIPDFNEDQQIGLSELIYLLQVLSGARSDELLMNQSPGSRGNRRGDPLPEQCRRGGGGGCPRSTLGPSRSA